MSPGFVPCDATWITYCRDYSAWALASPSIEYISTANVHFLVFVRASKQAPMSFCIPIKGRSINALSLWSQSRFQIKREHFIAIELEACGMLSERRYATVSRLRVKPQNCLSSTHRRPPEDGGMQYSDVRAHNRIFIDATAHSNTVPEPNMPATTEKCHFPPLHNRNLTQTVTYIFVKVDHTSF